MINLNHIKIRLKLFNLFDYKYSIKEIAIQLFKFEKEYKNDSQMLEHIKNAWIQLRKRDSENEIEELDEIIQEKLDNKIEEDIDEEIQKIVK